MTLPLNTNADPSDTIAQARYNMIEQQIRPWEVLDLAVLELLSTVRREEFVPAAYRAMAFMDLEIPLQGQPDDAAHRGQTMLAPRVEARSVQDLKVQATDRVLEIGTGSGYVAALLAAQAREVVTLEIDPALAAAARDNLQRAGVRNAEVHEADGAQALPVSGPFDVILLSGSVAEVPQSLLSQLKDGGRLAAIVGTEPMMRFTLIRRAGDRFEVQQPWDTVAARLAGFPEPSDFSF